MTIVQSVILGALQGIAEFLPISSSGHLIIMREFMELEGVPLLFDVLLHVSTLAVVIIIFRNRVWGIIRSFGRLAGGKKDESDRENLKLLLLIILATVFTVIIGLGISYLEMETRPRVVSSLFIVTGLLLVATRFTRGNRGYDQLGIRHGIITGIAQGLGVFPGISRSGITISAALYSGINREKAGEFSFLISIPAILGAFILELRDMGTLVESVSPLNLSIGIAVSFFVGYFSLLLLLRLIRGGKLFYFAFYLIPLGVFTLIYL